MDLTSVLLIVTVVAVVASSSVAIYTSAVMKRIVRESERNEDLLQAARAEYARTQDLVGVLSDQIRELRKTLAPKFSESSEVEYLRLMERTSSKQTVEMRLKLEAERLARMSELRRVSPDAFQNLFPSSKQQGVKSPSNKQEPVSGARAWDLIAQAIRDGGPGEIYIGGTPTSETINAVENAVSALASLNGGSIEWAQPRIGSWWRKFTVKFGAWLQNEDMGAKAQRAVEVQANDRWEGQSAKSYAEAVAVLAVAMKDVDQGFLVGKNVIVVKVIDSTGKSVVRGRTLTAFEILAYERGDLYGVLSDATHALKFISAPMSEASFEAWRKGPPTDPPRSSISPGIG